ncbi:MAG: hypothetical protein ACRDCX_01280 [Aeromonas sp.]
MNTEKSTERKIICAIDNSYSNPSNDVGKLNVFFEVLPSGDITPINTAEFFCETEQVFVVGQFAELKERFGDSLFEVISIPSITEFRAGDCRYITRPTSCSELKGLSCCEVIDQDIPNVSKTCFTVAAKPITKTLFIRNANTVYGPFDYAAELDEDSNVYAINIRSMSSPLPYTATNHIAKIDVNDYSQYIKESARAAAPVLLGNIKALLKDAEKIDFMSDDQILGTYGGIIAQNSDIRGVTKKTITQIKANYAKTIEYKTFPERFKRFFSTLEQAHNWEGVKNEMLDSFINTPAGKNVLEKYISQNKDSYFKTEKQACLAQMKQDHEALINDLKQQREKIKLEIHELKRERKETMLVDTAPAISLETLSAQQKQKIEKAIAEKKQTLEKLSAEVDALKATHDSYKNLEEVLQEISGIDREKERASKKLRLMEIQVQEVSDKLRKSNDQLTSRLLELKPHVDALSGIAPKPTTTPINYAVPIAPIDPKIENDELREQLIENVLEDLNSLGRKTDYNSVVNIITTIAQSQFTLFSGRPGSGKTSLAKMLGNSLGLQKRFLNIPVARGWTNSRDILGFYNSLSSSFNPAATGLYDLLTQLNNECKREHEAAPAICLLDEFNLSQPEHYFSPFLEMADPESERIIATGDHNSPYLEVPQYLRFLGTINNDDSVQSLTARMIDRAAIISFDDVEPNFDISLDSIKRLDKRDHARISGNKFIELFAPNSLELAPDIEHTLKQIVDTLSEENPERGMSICVSYRKIKAMRSYYNVASPLYIDSRFVALDYAVCQHIIPLLNGYGQNFGKRLVSLLNVIPSDMVISRKMLKRIIDIGNQNMFTYGFNL